MEQEIKSSNYDTMFVENYKKLKAEYNRLKDDCNQLEAVEITQGTEAWKSLNQPSHKCPLSFLREQQSALGKYLHILEVRAVIEHIKL